MQRTVVSVRAHSLIASADELIEGHEAIASAGTRRVRDEPLISGFGGLRALGLLRGDIVVPSRFRW